MLDAWAIIKSRQSRPEGSFGRWRLTPPGMGGTACGWGSLIRPLRGHLQLCTPQCAHWGALKGKAFYSLEGKSRDTALTGKAFAPLGEGE